MEVAFGAALAGKRSACVMKHVGVNVAADPLFTIAYTGINAGMVICVADDPGMHSSQNEQDSRHYAVSAKIPMLEPADSEEARLFAKRAFQLSEEYDTPVFLKLCTRISHSQSLVEEGQREDLPPRPYVKDIAQVRHGPRQCPAQPPHRGGAHPPAHGIRRDHRFKPGGAGGGTPPWHHHRPPPATSTPGRSFGRRPPS